MVMWHYGQKPFKVSHHPANSCGQRHCGGGDIMVSVSYMISHDHMIKGSCNFKGRSQSRYVTILQSLVAIGTLVVEIWFSFVTWFWLGDITSTCLINLTWVNSSRCRCLPNLVVIGLMEMEIKILSLILTWISHKKLNSQLWSTKLRNFQNQIYWFTIPVFQIHLAEKQEQKESRHLQSIMCFMQKKLGKW